MNSTPSEKKALQMEAMEPEQITQILIMNLTPSPSLPSAVARIPPDHDVMVLMRLI